MIEQIQQLKSDRDALILAHHYQDPEIQEAADFVGDTVALVAAAQESLSGTIVVCGARFMAETVKIMSPTRTVLLPDMTAGCSLVESCAAEAVRAFRKRKPDHAIIGYMHTSAEVKAETDILCTSGNAVAVVNSIPPDKPILFVPDSNLGRYVQQQTGRQNMQIWQGACIIHATFSLRRLTAARCRHPSALVAAHPECPASVLAAADFIGSPDSIVDFCAGHSAADFIVVSDSGLRFALQKAAPDKRFHFVATESCNCSECPYLRVNTLEKLAACLETLSPCITLSETVLKRARISFERMLAVN